MDIITFTNCPLDPSLGSGKTVINFTEGLRDFGNKVEVYSPNDFEILKLTKRASQFRQALGSYYLYKEKSRSKSFDIFEFYGAQFWIISWRLSKLKKRPLVVAHTNGLELLASRGITKYQSW